MKVTSVWEDGFRSTTGNGRQHRVVVDLPPAKRGTDRGPTALELSVMAFAGCVTTIFAQIAEKRRIAFDELAVEIDAEQSVGAKTIDRSAGRIRVRTKASRKDIETILRLTLETCPVGVLFAHAGVRTDWELTVET